MAKRKATLNGAAKNGHHTTNGHSNGHHETNGNGQSFDIKSLGQLLRLNSQENVELTHELSRELLALPTFVGERHLRPRHVAELAKHMRDGTFHWNMVCLITCRCNEPHNEKPTGTTFRMNGQHTCHARLELPASYRAPVRIMRYSASTEADMRRLYATIDRGAPRTKANIIHSYIDGTDEYDGYPSHVVRHLPAALAMWKWERPEHRASHNGDDIAYMLLKTDRSICQSVIGFLSQYKQVEHKHILRGPVVAAMLETFSRSVNKSIDFWTAVATGLGLNSERDPRKKLNKLLLTTTAHAAASNRINGNGGAISREAMYRACIHCWNLWRKGEAVNGIRVPERRPVAIA